MIRLTYSKVVLIIAFLAIMLTVPSTHLMAQTAEESSSVTSSTRSTTVVLPAQEQSSVTSSTSSTTVAQPAREQSSVTTSTKSSTVAQASGEQRCVGHCRDSADRSLSECNAPGHPHHKKCKKWAREREEDCLEKCYRD